MSSSNCCFLTCIQVSQDTGQVVWYSHLFQNFPQFLVIHTVKGFGIVNKAEIDVFLELSWFFNDPADVGNLISGSSAFSKSSLYFPKKISVVFFFFALCKKRLFRRIENTKVQSMFIQYRIFSFYQQFYRIYLSWHEPCQYSTWLWEHHLHSTKCKWPSQGVSRAINT